MRKYTIKEHFIFWYCTYYKVPKGKSFTNITCNFNFNQFAKAFRVGKFPSLSITYFQSKQSIFFEHNYWTLPKNKKIVVETVENGSTSDNSVRMRGLTQRLDPRRGAPHEQQHVWREKWHLLHFANGKTNPIKDRTSQNHGWLLRPEGLRLQHGDDKPTAEQAPAKFKQAKASNNDLRSDKEHQRWQKCHCPYQTNSLNFQTARHCKLFFCTGANLIKFRHT